MFQTNIATIQMNCTKSATMEFWNPEDGLKLVRILFEEGGGGWLNTKILIICAITESKFLLGEGGGGGGYVRGASYPKIQNMIFFCRTNLEYLKFWNYSFYTVWKLFLYFFLGTLAYDKLSSLLYKTALVNDIKKLSPDAQTSCLEGFHATLNYWHPKLICYSWMGSLCRYVCTKKDMDDY